jgi:hypothetical protein
MGSLCIFRGLKCDGGVLQNGMYFTSTPGILEIWPTSAADRSDLLVRAAYSLTNLAWLYM